MLPNTTNIKRFQLNGEILAHYLNLFVPKGGAINWNMLKSGGSLIVKMSLCFLLLGSRKWRERRHEQIRLTLINRSDTSMALLHWSWGQSQEDSLLIRQMEEYIQGFLEKTVPRISCDLHTYHISHPPVRAT